jgi:Cdc6-like AAA superfamily ATPase
MMKQDDAKTIYTNDGIPIRWFNKDVDDYLDKTTLIYGGTGSGKTTIIEEILYKVRYMIPAFLVIVPSTSSHYYTAKLPERCVKEDLTKRKLEQIWQRQSSLTQIYKIANNIKNLARVFEKVADRCIFGF